MGSSATLLCLFTFCLCAIEANKQQSLPTEHVALDSGFMHENKYQNESKQLARIIVPVVSYSSFFRRSL